MELIDPIQKPNLPIYRRSWFMAILSILLIVIIGELAIQNRELKKQLLSLKATPPSLSLISPSPISNTTTNWKTYINSELGFSFKYPGTMYVITDQYNPGSIPPHSYWQISITNTSKEDSSIRGSDYSIDISVNKYPKDARGNPVTEKDLSKLVQDYSDTISYPTFANHRSVRHQAKYWGKTKEEGGSISYQFFDNGKLFILDGSTESLRFITFDKFDQILSTFKFVD